MVEYIPTQDMVTDIMNKSLTRASKVPGGDGCGLTPPLIKRGCCNLITLPVTTGPIFRGRQQVPSTVQLPGTYAHCAPLCLPLYLPNYLQTRTSPCLLPHGFRTHSPVLG